MKVIVEIEFDMQSIKDFWVKNNGSDPDILDKMSTEQLISSLGWDIDMSLDRRFYGLVKLIGDPKEVK